MKEIRIADFTISDNSPCFIIAELSANHNGSLQRALDTIRQAKLAGADAIKLQTYTADTITLDVRSDDFKVKQGTIWDGKYLYDLYKEAYTPWEWHSELFSTAKKEGLICFSSPFDKTAVDFLETLNTPAYKIASFEITDIPLIEYVASKAKPVIISTGISEEADIQLALDACHRMGNHQIILLKCTSSYPAPLEEANLIMVKDLSTKYNVFTGLSDHTMGSTAPVVARVFGAKVLEKHFTMDRAEGGPDSSFSMNPDEFSSMVKAVRDAEMAIGKVNYKLTEGQLKGKQFSRSLYAVADINIGDEINEQNVRSVRPGYGMHPKYYKEVLGKKSSKQYRKGDRFSG